jgi:hypothetical protein
VRVSVLVLAILSFPLAPARAQQTYKWIDKDGNIHITTTPPPDDSPSGPAPKPTSPVPPAPKPAVAVQPAPNAAPANEPAQRRFEIPYVARERRSQRVIVPVTFNGRVTAPMALDTGSPGLIISVALAEKLDLFSRDDGALLVQARGIGGATPAIRSIIDRVEVGGASQRYVPVTVSGQFSDQFEGVVGMDFMAQYAMSIDPKQQQVVLQEQDLGGDLPGGHPESWWRDNFAEFRALRDAWKAYAALVQQKLDDGAGDRERLSQLETLALHQLGEAEKLYDRLDRFASQQSVPRHWR